MRAQLRIDGDAGFAIERVRPGGLASRAGLERFDVVIALDGNPVHDAAELEALGKPGSHTITVVRAGERRTIEFRNGSAKPAPETPQKK
ncbi:MAG: PDZ domain-containing protein [Planctomycetota bacterium]|nr:MAG: PDZ domain-containing protein [Planctomycetota bacterium]